MKNTSSNFVMPKKLEEKNLGRTKLTLVNNQSKIKN